MHSKLPVTGEKKLIFPRINTIKRKDMQDGGKMNDFDTGPSMDSLNTTDSGDHSKVRKN